jgi:hypothetical protein
VLKEREEALMCRQCERREQRIVQYILVHLVRIHQMIVQIHLSFSEIHRLATLAIRKTLSGITASSNILSSLEVTQALKALVDIGPYAGA